MKEVEIMTALITAYLEEVNKAANDILSEPTDDNCKCYDENLAYLYQELYNYNLCHEKKVILISHGRGEDEPWLINVSIGTIFSVYTYELTFDNVNNL